jgi:hypothetical protein
LPFRLLGLKLLALWALSLKEDQKEQLYEIETDGLHICISGHYRVLRTVSFHAADRATRIALREQAAVCTYL